MAGLCDSHVGLLLTVCRCLLLRRFTSALTPFDLVTACISTELLPARPAASIKKRFANLICKRGQPAVSWPLAAWQSQHHKQSAPDLAPNQQRCPKARATCTA